MTSDPHRYLSSLRKKTDVFENSQRQFRKTDEGNKTDHFSLKGSMEGC